ncbi:MAG: hypothetical protein LBL24_11965 [Bacteroidales bacterium]|jgi:hypothetical protein|nr:hypothetical protein [Bacteroidales bacterium]
MEGIPQSKLCGTSRKEINEAGDTILIKTSYLDNWWVVGSPCGTFGFVDVGHDMMSL